VAILLARFLRLYLEIKKLRLSPNSGLPTTGVICWSLQRIFKIAASILPFITEELWHRFGQNTSIALARYPQAGATDEAAEREMGLLQDMVTTARKLKADNGLDDRLELTGVLYCRNGSRNIEFPIVEFLAKVKLEIRTDAPPALTGAVRSTAHFDLSLQLPEVDTEALRQRLVKEIGVLEKLVVSNDRQLANEEFVNRAPAKIVESMRAKRAEYVAQIEKNRDMLDQLR